VHAAQIHISGTHERLCAHLDRQLLQRLEGHVFLDPVAIRLVRLDECVALPGRLQRESDPGPAALGLGDVDMRVKQPDSERL
jgi:hypothetical protein